MSMAVSTSSACRSSRPDPSSRSIPFEQSMKFLRSIFNPSEADSAAEADPTAKAHAPTAGEPEQAIPDEGTREVAVQRDFSRGLSDLARRQMQYERYRWEPAAQIDPRGTWFGTEDVE